MTFSNSIQLSYCRCNLTPKNSSATARADVPFRPVGLGRTSAIPQGQMGILLPLPQRAEFRLGTSPSLSGGFVAPLYSFQIAAVPNIRTTANCYRAPRKELYNVMGGFCNPNEPPVKSIEGIGHYQCPRIWITLC